MNTEKKQNNWYVITDCNGKETGYYVFASNMKEAMKIFKTNENYKELYKKYGYFGQLRRVYNGGVRG